MTDNKTYQDDYLCKLKALNAVVKGWANYYRAVNPYSTFEKLENYTWLRLTKWLKKKYRLSWKQVRDRFKYHQAGPKGGMLEYAAQDENGKWVWRYRATQTRIVGYFPYFKRNWPNPYLEKVKSEYFELPTLKTRWNGYREAPIYTANRREVLRRANSQCERCGRAVELTVHCKHRVNRGRRQLRNADHRPEMMEALCFKCQGEEHRAENIYYNKLRNGRKASELKADGAPGAGATSTPGAEGRMQKRTC